MILSALKALPWGLSLALLAGVFSAATLLCSCTPAGPAVQPHVKLAGGTMGTTWHVTVVEKSGRDQALSKQVQAILDRVNATMSTWDPDSELSRFNAAAPSQTPFEVSQGTAVVSKAALDMAKTSGGAFDPTVLPLVELWGFGGSSQTEPPTPEQISTTRTKVDFRRVQVDVEQRTLRKTAEGVRLDLSAIAKGYAVDLTFQKLVELGCTNFMVEVGGEVRTRGSNPKGEAWGIGIDRPNPSLQRSGALQAAVGLSDQALATSGDYRNFRMVNGKRVSHTIDPRTGSPISHNLASVSVVAPTCMEADAVATAVNVLGLEEGWALIEALPKVEGYLIIREAGGGFGTRVTPGFRELLLSRNGE